MKICLIAALLFCSIMITLALEARKRGRLQCTIKNNIATLRWIPTASDNRKNAKKPKNKGVSSGTGSDNSTGTGSAANCTSLGGICQPRRFICQGRYLNDRCPDRAQCCVPDGAWSVLCAGHYNNRVRACDEFGCGAFNSRRGPKLHKAVDIVCHDFGVIQAPFSGVLSGPVSHRDPAGIQHDGVKLVSQVHCVKLLNMRPYRYMGSVTRGSAVGYVLPLQERFSGITSHLQLRIRPHCFSLKSLLWSLQPF